VKTLVVSSDIDENARILKLFTSHGIDVATDIVVVTALNEVMQL
jgi:hypothetical protein